MLDRNPLLAAVAGAALLACASRPATPSAPEVEALDKFGAYRARRLVLEPVAAVRLGPGDAHGEEAGATGVATLGRRRDAGAMLLLRFAVDLPPGAAVMSAYVLLDRVPSVDADPSPVPLHAARIVEPWDVRSIAWGRAPRIEEAHLPRTALDAATGAARLDVRALVQRWQRHAPDDQGIAIVADGSSTTGMAFAFADRGAAGDEAPPVVSVRAPGPPSLYSTAEVTEGTPPPTPRGPRLELYVRP